MSNVYFIIAVECSIANIELASTIDAIDFQSKIQAVDKIIETFVTNSDKEMVQILKEEMDQIHTGDTAMPEIEVSEDSVKLM